MRTSLLSASPILLLGVTGNKTDNFCFALYGEDWKFTCKQIGKAISGSAKCCEENKEGIVWSTISKRVTLLRGWLGKVTWRRWLLSWGQRVVTIVSAGLLKGTSMTWLGIWKMPSALESREQGGHERRWSREASKWDHSDSSSTVRSLDFLLHTVGNTGQNMERNRIKRLQAF